MHIYNSLLGMVLLLGPAIGREKLFCSYPDVVRTVSNPPTFFCSFSGTANCTCIASMQACADIRTVRVCGVVVHVAYLLVN